MRPTIAMGADHGGFSLKNELLDWLREGYEILDLGAHSIDPLDDYPDFAETVANAVSSEQVQRGIIICGSGVGACIAANKVWGARACLCHDTYSARQGVEHDDMNILCLGARIVGFELARELVKAFLEATFIGEERYCRRLGKVIAIEQRSFQEGRGDHE